MDRLQVFIIASAVALAASGPALGADFAGEYVMKGRGDAANDSAYSGTCTLKQQGKGYDVSCLNMDTNHTYVGRGLAAGNVLAVMIGDRLTGDHGAIYEGEYLVVFERKDDGNLVGRWIDVLSGHQGNETLTLKR